MLKKYLKLFSLFALSIFMVSISAGILEKEMLVNDVRIKSEKLIVAVKIGNAEEVANLLEAGVNINFKDDMGETALHIASEEGYSEIVQLLLGAGAEVSIKNNNDETALDCAMDADVIKLLLDAGAGKYLDDIVSLISEGKLPVDSKDKNGNTALYEAVNFNNLELCSYLIKLGANVNAVNSFGKTILQVALEDNIDKKEGDKIIKLLIESGSALNHNRETEEELWIWAIVSNENIENVKFLINKGINLNTEFYYGTTILDFTEIFGLIELSKILKSYGAKCSENSNVRDDLVEIFKEAISEEGFNNNKPIDQNFFKNLLK